jgi:hypothetical protein
MRAAAGALVCCAMLSMLSGCALWDRVFHRDRPKDAGCVEKPFSQNTEVRPPLKVPDGLSSPDTRNAIKVPELTGPERMRARNEPCLSRPPSYFTKPLDIAVTGPPVRQHWWQFWRKKATAPVRVPASVSQPAPTPAPTPVPVPVPVPVPAPAPEAPPTAK